ncbi:hypothetical protein L1049_010713 [Liquidambar formosana]|uniref:Uncharacterized protein n=1 Tax=Liquidambar formosana TaxID=63359 RepID=A0AAP0N864_LIQFO
MVGEILPSTILLKRIHFRNSIISNGGSPIAVVDAQNLQYQIQLNEMKNKPSPGQDVSSANAVLLGALTPGVNGPTWITLKYAFLMLGLALAVMLGLAQACSDTLLILHVTFLVLITVTLFLLLSWYRISSIKPAIFALFVYAVVKLKMSYCW